MRYLVLTWDSLDLKKYRKIAWYDEADNAWAHAAELWKNPRTRLAVVLAFPDKPKRDLDALFAEQANMPQRFTIPRWLTGNTEERIVEGWSEGALGGI